MKLHVMHAMVALAISSLLLLSWERGAGMSLAQEPDAQLDAFGRWIEPEWAAAHGHAPSRWSSEASPAGPSLTINLYFPYVSPGDRYAFVEYWSDHHFETCPAVDIDFPTYSFDWDSKRLFVLTAFNPRLAAEDIGYLGLGTAHYGGGSGVGSRLQPFASTPVETDLDFELRDFDAHGARIEVLSQDLHIAPGESWTHTTTRVDGEGCVERIEHRVSNHGFLNRSTIHYHGIGYSQQANRTGPR